MERTRKPRVRISVEGYGTCLPEDDIKMALINHFSSCGEVFNVTFSEGRVGRAFIILRGDGAKGKALQNALVKVAPTGNEETERYRARLRKETYEDKRFRFGITVRGYDTSLPADDVRSTLMKHFSSCGDITHVYISTLDSKVNIYFSGEDEEEKALKLDGSEVGGWKLVATREVTLPPWEIVLAIVSQVTVLRWLARTRRSSSLLRSRKGCCRSLTLSLCQALWCF